MNAHDYDDGHDVRHAVQRYDCVSAIGPDNVARYGSKVELLLYRYLNDLGANASPGATIVGHSYPYYMAPLHIPSEIFGHAQIRMALYISDTTTRATPVLV